MYGASIPSYMDEPRSVIGATERSMTGNLVLRIGQENEQGWHQTEHVVLTPEEAVALANEILKG